MKTVRFTTVALWLAALMFLTACASSRGMGRHSGRPQSEQSSPRKTKSDKKKSKKDQQDQALAEQDPTIERAPLDKETILEQVNENVQLVRFVTSKIRFSVEMGNRQMTLTGNLKMKRDDVIRIQLMAFGFVEAGRLEFTQDYVLIVDRINKQYIKVPYEQLEFLRLNDINFFTLQSLFWNELYQPGKIKSSRSPASYLTAEYSDGEDVILSYDREKLSYRWLTEKENARIKMTNIRYNDYYRGSYQLNWDYEEFKVNERRFFPTKHLVTFTAPETEVKIEMKLNNIGKDEDWEPRTDLSGKYRQMSVDEILRRFLSL
jgi:flagellar motor switch/type III secretory pathway protein FliN